MTTERDNRSNMQKKFLDIATECVMPLIRASDAKEPLTPLLIGQVQTLVAKALEQVHFGFHPELAD